MTDQNHGLVIATPYDMELEQFGASLIRRQANRCKLLVWIRENLIEGTDFGKIHVIGKNKCGLGKACKTDWHYSRPVLFKGGAESICSMLGVTPRFPNLHEYERAALQGIELKCIVLHCELQNSTGWVLADGVGARSLQQDQGDLNKSLKMAEKAAHIDATLRLAGLSALFTQDLDDTPPKDEASSEPVYMVTGTQLKKLNARLQGYDLPQERVLKYCSAKWGISRIEELTWEQFNELDSKLEAFAEKVKSERQQEPISADALRKVVSFALQHTVDLTEVLRKVGVNRIGELTYASLDALWKALEARAERQAIQREAPLIEIPPGSEAEKLMERAKQIRTEAKYADGQSYYRDLEEAQNLENAARKLLAESQNQEVAA
jgi:hypothetical protein